MKSIPQASYKQSSVAQFFAHMPNAKMVASGYIEEQAYICAMQALYQLWSQHNMCEGQGVLYQYTQYFAAPVVK